MIDQLQEKRIQARQLLEALKPCFLLPAGHRPTETWTHELYKILKSHSCDSIHLRTSRHRCRQGVEAEGRGIDFVRIPGWNPGLALQGCRRFHASVAVLRHAFLLDALCWLRSLLVIFWFRMHACQCDLLNVRLNETFHSGLVTLVSVWLCRPP